MKILFLNPPSFERFDSAGARFQATRKTHSLWYPVWLGYATALIKESKLLDCPAMNIDLEELKKVIKDYDLIVLNTSTPSLENDVKVAESLKNVKPELKIIFVGPHPSILPEETLKLSEAIDAVARKEFEFTILEIYQGKPFEKIKGLSFRKGKNIIHNPDRELFLDLDQLPLVSKIYKRDLPIRAYHLPFTLHPYIATYAGRGCPYQCTFCLWPQTFTGRRYRKRSVKNVIEEIKFIKDEMPEIAEIFFDDDTFTIDHQWVREFCQAVKPLKITWSTNARADVPFDLLKTMKKAGCRLLVVGYESADQNILNNVKKGITFEQMSEFTKNCQKIGLMIHGTFVLGLPGETKETIKKTYQFACHFNFDTIQVSIATPFPGTEFYSYCQKYGCLKKGPLVDIAGYQSPTVNYPHLSSEVINKEVEKFLFKYYFRIPYLLKSLKLILSSQKEAKRIAISGWEYAKYLLTRKLGYL